MLQRFVLLTFLLFPLLVWSIELNDFNEQRSCYSTEYASSKVEFQLPDPLENTRGVFLTYNINPHFKDKEQRLLKMEKSLAETIQSIAEFSAKIVINIVVPLEVWDILEQRKEFLTFLEKYKSQIHLIKMNWEVLNQRNKGDVWTQDKFLFILHYGKPAIYFIPNCHEKELSEEKSYSFELARQCGWELIRAEKRTPLQKIDRNSFCMGGNFLTMPGRWIATGVHLCRDFECNIFGVKEFKKGGQTYLTSIHHQEILEDLIKKGVGHSLFDAGFSYVGHADELFSAIKIPHSSQSRVAILINKPIQKDSFPNNRIFQLMEKSQIKIESEMARRSPELEIEWIDVPVLFTMRGTTQWPNMVNGLNLVQEGRSLFLFPSSQNFERSKGFDTLLIQKLKNLGVETKAIDFDWAYRDDGGLHCLIKHFQKRIE